MRCACTPGRRWAGALPDLAACRRPAQADKDIAKAIAAMGELEVALAAKKEVSGRVKALKKEVEGARAEARHIHCPVGALQCHHHAHLMCIMTYSVQSRVLYEHNASM